MVDAFKTNFAPSAVSKTLADSLTIGTGAQVANFLVVPWIYFVLTLLRLTHPSRIFENHD